MKMVCGLHIAALLLLGLAGVKFCHGVLPPTVPEWPPTYDMKESLITMQLNYSGLSSPQRGAEFGIVSYDWSNAKKLWAARKPMDCEELLVEQAIQTKGAGAKHVFVYRNIVKALPWFTTVREKLNDPAYADFFLPFARGSAAASFHVPACAAENQTLCSIFYHDQLQTPQVPTDKNPHPDGLCDEHCDCGMKHPCGEYLFNHRNGSMLREFLVEQVILGPTSVGHEAIDGLFLDDFWCSDMICQHTANATAGCPCNDPFQGPTEVDAFSQLDMGLTDTDIMEMAIEWNKTMTVLQHALLERKAYTWSLVYAQENANAEPHFLRREECVAELRSSCQMHSKWQHNAMLFGFTIANATQLAQLQQDLAYFLLVRGPYAWAGWGVWGMTWPFNAASKHGTLPALPHGVPLPPEFHVDYGEPLGLCFETAASGIFQREWSRASVQLNCNTFEASIVMANTDYEVATQTEMTTEY